MAPPKCIYVVYFDSSEATENIAPGWLARETYHILSTDEFKEVLELAAPGKGFELY